MVLAVATSRIDGVMIVHVSGAIFFGEESACLRNLVQDLLRESRQIVLDLGNVTHLDSGGVGALVAVHALARKVGAEVKFANLDTHTREVLQTTKVWKVIEIFGETEDAIASFSR
jgi:anti-sigma B factor antagonist